MPITFFFVDQVFLFSARRIVVDNAIFYLSISQWIPEIFAVKFEHCLKLHQLLYILPSQILRGNAPWLVCLLARSPPGWFAPATFAPWLVRPLCLACSPPVPGWFALWLVLPLARSPLACFSPGSFTLSLSPLPGSMSSGKVPWGYSLNPWSYRHAFSEFKANFWPILWKRIVRVTSSPMGVH